MNGSLQAALWDLDGTLIDSEPYWIAAEHALVERFGGTWTDEHATALVGNAMPASARILQQAGVRLPVDEIISKLSASVRTSIAVQGPPWRPGAVDLLHDLRRNGVRTALVTMSFRDNAEFFANQLPFKGFDELVTGDMVTLGKPHPEPYLAGAAALEAPLDTCVAFEDSDTGAQSALAAGICTIAVPNLTELPTSPLLHIWPTFTDRTAADAAAALRGQSA